MNIAIAIDYINGLTGAEMYVYELSKELSKLKHNIVIIAPTEGILVQKIYEAGVKISPLPTKLPFQPEILISSYISSQLTANLLYYLPNIPCIQCVHSEFPCGRPLKHPNIKKYAYVRESIRPVLLQDNFPEDKLIYIPNGIDKNRFNLNYPLPENKKKVILFVGTFDRMRWETIQHLITRSHIEKFDLWLMGKNYGLAPQVLNLASRVISPSWDVEIYTKLCDETAGIMLGRTTIEGWLCGKPGWIYDVEDNGVIKSIQLYQPPENLSEFFSENTAKKMEKTLFEVLSLI